jgi:hypothetical protein
VASHIQASGVATTNCNAACGVNGIMAAHVALAGYAFGITSGIAVPLPHVSAPSYTANTLAPDVATAAPVAVTAAPAPGSFSLQSIPVWLIVALVGVLVLVVL